MGSNISTPMQVPGIKVNVASSMFNQFLLFVCNHRPHPRNGKTMTAFSAHKKISSNTVLIANVLPNHPKKGFESLNRHQCASAYLNSMHQSAKNLLSRFLNLTRTKQEKKKRDATIELNAWRSINLRLFLVTLHIYVTYIYICGYFRYTETYIYHIYII